MRQRVPKKNLLRAGRAFFSHAVPAILKPLRTLWNEIIGFLFICIAIIFVPSGVRTVRNFDGSIGAVLSVAMFAFFVVLMAGYGISSFRRARKISRS